VKLFASIAITFSCCKDCSQLANILQDFEK
jgi:hypothetical protein